MKILGAILHGIGVFLLSVLMLEYLWNWTMPDLFNFKRITYLQALLLFMLANVLFKHPLKNKKDE